MNFRTTYKMVFTYKLILLYLTDIQKIKSLLFSSINFQNSIYSCNSLSNTHILSIDNENQHNPNINFKLQSIVKFQPFDKHKKY